MKTSDTMKMILASAASLLLIGSIAPADDAGAAAPTIGFARSAAVPQTVAELWAGRVLPHAETAGEVLRDVQLPCIPEDDVHGGLAVRPPSQSLGAGDLWRREAGRRAT